mmetsp:Transcript_19689/g.28927  ORF Transcript_19689/g.28927 Transcript_19689/m.28927 type:complete len:110 (-) Transcript_19689:7-336(-)
MRVAAGSRQIKKIDCTIEPCSECSLCTGAPAQLYRRAMVCVYTKYCCLRVFPLLRCVGAIPQHAPPSCGHITSKHITSKHIERACIILTCMLAWQCTLRGSSGHCSPMA